MLLDVFDAHDENPCVSIESSRVGQGRGRWGVGVRGGASTCMHDGLALEL